MNCLLLAATRAFDVSADDIINFLGHSGIFPLDSEGNSSGFHIQEIARYAYYRHGHNLVPIEPEFGIQTPTGLIVRRQHRDWYNERLYHNCAILEGYTARTGHAAFWDRKTIHDTKPDQNFQVTCAWLIT